MWCICGRKDLQPEQQKNNVPQRKDYLGVADEPKKSTEELKKDVNELVKSYKNGQQVDAEKISEASSAIENKINFFTKNNLLQGYLDGNMNVVKVDPKDKENTNNELDELKKLKALLEEISKPAAINLTR